VDAYQGTIAQTGEITPLLFFVAMLPQGYHAREQMGTYREDETAVVAAIAKSLQRDGTGQGVQATTSILLWHR
jgi:hypothetical protein